MYTETYKKVGESIGKRLLDLQK